MNLRKGNEIDCIKERDNEWKKKMDVEWHEEMKRMWKIIGAEAGAGKVLEDPRSKVSTLKDMENNTGVRPKEKKALSMSEGEMVSSEEEKESKNKVSEIEEKVVEEKSKSQKRSRSKNRKI